MTSPPSDAPQAVRLGRMAGAYRTWQVLSLALGGAARAWWLSRTRGLRSPEAQARAVDALWRAEGRRLAERAAHLGGLLIKVGQFLSTRADVLPIAFTRELSALQDALAPADPVAVRRSLEEAFGASPESVFAAFTEPPLAAASLAQVHAARLPDGREVAVKVLRPGIESRVETDLESLRVVAAWAGRHTAWGRRLDVLAIWREFAEVTRAELDMPGEAERARRFAAMFVDDPAVRSPLPIEGWIRPRVLVLERVGGLRPDDRQALIAAGVAPEAVARRLVGSYMRQWLVAGFFHADPHPGNLFVDPADGGLIYVDFGMMAEIGPKDRRALEILVRGVVTHDPAQVAEGAIGLGFVRPGTDRHALIRAFAWFLDRLDRSRGRLSGAERGEADRLSEDIQEFMYTQPFQIPARYTFLGRALGILRGMVSRLAPDLDFMDVLVNEARRQLGEAAAERAAGGAGVLFGALGDRLWRRPRQIGRLLDRLDAGEPLPVRVEGGDGGREVARALARLAQAVLAAGAGLSAAFLPGAAHFGRDLLWVLAALLALSAVWPTRPAA